MTTEDDTFNALRREPFGSVLKELGTMAGTPDELHITKHAWAYDNENLLPYWVRFFEVRGWTIQEFEEECKRYTSANAQLNRLPSKGCA